jgi:hypothetical protein
VFGFYVHELPPVLFVLVSVVGVSDWCCPVLFAVAVCLIGCCLVLLLLLLTVPSCDRLWCLFVCLRPAAGSERERHPLALMRVETGVIIKDLIVTSDQLFNHTLSPLNWCQKWDWSNFFNKALAQAAPDDPEDA